MKSELRMDAYYYGFDKTGVEAIDLILSAVACAGKAYHHTNEWNDECSYVAQNMRGKTPVEWIQNAANDAAASLSARSAAEDASSDGVDK